MGLDSPQVVGLESPRSRNQSKKESSQGDFDQESSENDQNLLAQELNEEFKVLNV